MAKLITLFESTCKGAQQEKHDVISYLETNTEISKKSGLVVGFTGTPGAGKSSLIAELSKQLLAENPALTLAVLAVDPSSQISGGAILGDRTRMHLGSKQPRLFFRSQASNNELGGVTQNTYQATRILRYFFDFIFIETVGIGQNEVDIQFMTDHTFLVMQPLAGDQIQFMKCGIMEIPDSFIVNKCDEEKLARNSYHMLRTSLKQARILDLNEKDDYKQASRDNVFMTSALKHLGFESLAEHIKGLSSHQDSQQKRDEFYLKKHIQTEFGKFGLSAYQNMSLPLGWKTMTYESREEFFQQQILELLPSLPHTKT